MYIEVLKAVWKIFNTRSRYLDLLIIHYRGVPQFQGIHGTIIQHIFCKFSGHFFVLSMGLIKITLPHLKCYKRLSWWVWCPMGICLLEHYIGRDRLVLDIRNFFRIRFNVT